MAVKTRSQLSDDDLNVYLPDNTTQEIDPSEHRQSNINHSDSALNKLDDNLFPVPTDDSLEYGSDPTTGWDDSAVHDLKHPPKKYVDERTSAKDVTIYYVSLNGDDTTAEPGNDRLPYETIQGAVTAINLLSSGARANLKVFPGAYSEGQIDFTSEIDLFIDISNCQILGTFDFNAIVQKITVVAFGGTINWSDVTGETVQCRSQMEWYGGEIIRSGAQSNTAALSASGTATKRIISCKLNSDSKSAITGVTNTFFSSCEILGQNNGVFRTDNSRFVNCVIRNNQAGAGTANAAVNKNNGDPNNFFGCTIIGSNGITEETAESDNFFNCYIEGLLGHGVYYSVNQVIDIDQYFKGCIIKAASHCVEFSASTEVTAYIHFAGCTFIAGTGEIIKEPISYDAGFTGYVVLSNNQINKALNITVDPTKYKLNNNFNYV